MTRLLASFARTDPGEPQPPQPPIEQLTNREEAVLDSGNTNSEITDDPHLSISTVKSHLGSLVRKLNARNRVELRCGPPERAAINR